VRVWPLMTLLCLCADLCAAAKTIGQVSCGNAAPSAAKAANPIEIVQEFDHSGCQSWVYHGEFYCTPDYALYAPHRIAMIHTTKINAYRAAKACIRGWKRCKGEGMIEMQVTNDTTVRLDAPLMFVHNVSTLQHDNGSTINFPSLGINFQFTKKTLEEEIYDIGPAHIPKDFLRHMPMDRWLVSGKALSAHRASALALQPAAARQDAYPVQAWLTWPGLARCCPCAAGCRGTLTL